MLIFEHPTQSVGKWTAIGPRTHSGDVMFLVMGVDGNTYGGAFSLFKDLGNLVTEDQLPENVRAVFKEFEATFPPDAELVRLGDACLGTTLEKRVLIQDSTPHTIDPDEFDFSGLDSIDLEQARRIARQPWYVNLSGLETLDVETAEVLADHKGTLCLTGLRQLSTQAAEALAKHEGPVLLDRDHLPAEILAIVKPTCQ